MRLTWIIALVTLLLTLVALRYLIGSIRWSWRFAIPLIGVSVALLAFFWLGKPGADETNPTGPQWQTRLPDHLR